MERREYDRDGGPELVGSRALAPRLITTSDLLGPSSRRLSVDVLSRDEARQPSHQTRAES